MARGTGGMYRIYWYGWQRGIYDYPSREALLASQGHGMRFGSDGRLYWVDGGAFVGNFVWEPLPNAPQEFAT